MQQHDFKSLDDFRGASLPYFTTHHELVRMQVRHTPHPFRFILHMCD